MVISARDGDGLHVELLQPGDDLGLGLDLAKLAVPELCEAPVPPRHQLPRIRHGGAVIAPCGHPHHARPLEGRGEGHALGQHGTEARGRLAHPQLAFFVPPPREEGAIHRAHHAVRAPYGEVGGLQVVEAVVVPGVVGRGAAVPYDYGLLDRTVPVVHPGVALILPAPEHRAPLPPLHLHDGARELRPGGHPQCLAGQTDLDGEGGGVVTAG
mmetsp:Transcript_4695/g.15553  ORF Transcript_4695/g.15553 Transcript_4695/m.15553 type:complete len:212 (+) Transcript_4695:394-1029(+)